LTFTEYRKINPDMTEASVRKCFEIERDLDSLPEPTIKFKPWGRRKLMRSAMRTIRG